MNLNAGRYFNFRVRCHGFAAGKYFEKNGVMFLGEKPNSARHWAEHAWAELGGVPGQAEVNPFVGEDGADADLAAVLRRVHRGRSPVASSRVASYRTDFARVLDELVAAVVGYGYARLPEPVKEAAAVAVWTIGRLLYNPPRNTASQPLVDELVSAARCHCDAVNAFVTGSRCDPAAYSAACILMAIATCN